LSLEPAPPAVTKSRKLPKMHLGVVPPIVGPAVPPVVRPALRPEAPPAIPPAIGQTAGPVVPPAAGPAVLPVARPAPPPATRPGVRPAIGPVTRPAPPPAAGPVAAPAIRPAAGPAVRPVARPVPPPAAGAATGPAPPPAVAPALLGPTSLVAGLVAALDMIPVHSWASRFGRPVPGHPPSTPARAPGAIARLDSDRSRIILTDDGGPISPGLVCPWLEIREVSPQPSPAWSREGNPGDSK